MALVGLAVYAITVAYPLVWDDVLLQEFIVRRLQTGGLLGLLTSDFTIGVTVTGYYRPVILLSLWLDGVLSQGLSTYHLTNVLLHASVSWLVFLLLRRLLNSEAAAFWGGLLFAVHPVHVESVAFVSGRTDLFAALFALWATILWLEDREAGGGVPAWRRVAHGAAYLFAVLSKETALVLPAALLLWDALRPTEARTRAGWWRSNRADLALWSSAAAIAILLRLASGVKPSPLDLPDPLLLVEMVASYFRLLVAPWPLNAFTMASHLRLDVITAVSALALLAAFALLAPARHGRAGLLGFVWMMVFLAPALIGTGPGTAAIAERFLYLPSIGPCLAIGYAIARWDGTSGPRRFVRGLAALVLAGFTILSVARARVWRDGTTLFLDVTRKSPSYEAGFYNLAHFHREQRRYPEAAEAYRAAIRLKPAEPRFHVNLGIVSGLMSDHEAAERAYRGALAADSTFADAHFNLGATYERMDRPLDAVRAYSKFLELRPGDSEAETRVVILLPRLEPAVADSLRRALLRGR